MRRVLYIGILLGLAVSFVSCRKKAPSDGWTDTINSGFIRIAADESFKNLVDAEVDAFGMHNPYAMVVPVYANETEVVRLLVEDSVRLVIVSRDINAKEKRKFEERNRIVRKSLIGFDGIALITNKENKDSLIGVPTIKKILKGEITEWSQVYPGSQLGTIRIIFDNPESGVLRYVLDSITGMENLSPNLYALNNGVEVVEKVSQLPNALGLIGFNVIGDDSSTRSRELSRKVQLMRVSREEKASEENSYFPYTGEIRGEKYPLWRPVYALLCDPKSGLSSGLSFFLAHEVSQKVILKCGLLPVTDSQNNPVNVKDEYPNSNE